MNNEIPPDDLEHEIDMAVEEFHGKPTAGPPAERIAALVQHIAYLKRCLDGLCKRPPECVDPELVLCYTKDINEARTQLAELQNQLRGRN
jgi:hypothetical protein